MPALSDCEFWTDVVGYVFIVGAWGYMFLMLALAARSNALFKAGGDAEQLPDGFPLTPRAHFRMLAYLYGRSRAQIPDTLLYVIVVALRFTIPPTFVLAILGFLMLAATNPSHPAGCWRWLPESIQPGAHAASAHPLLLRGSGLES